MGWSIVVYSGLYIDPLGELGVINKTKAHYGLSLEIVGLSEVRILLHTDRLLLCGIDLTLKNLSIYDLRQDGFDYVVCKINTAILKLYGVNIKFKEKDTFNVWGEDAKVEAVNCFLTKGLRRCQVMWACNIFAMSDGGKLRLENCYFDNAGCVTVGNTKKASHPSHNSGVVAKKTTFKNTSFGLDGGTGNFENCEFIMDNDIPISITDSARICVNDTKFVIDWAFAGSAIEVARSSAKAIINNCEFQARKGLQAIENGSAIVKNCLFNCKYVAEMYFNPKGVVKLEACHTRRKKTIILKDLQSNNLESSFLGTNTITLIQDVYVEMPGKKEISAITIKQQKEFREEWKQYKNLWSYEKFLAYQRWNQKYDGKICGKCGFLEIIKSEKAFKPDNKNKKFKLKTKIYDRQTFVKSEKVAIDDATHPQRPPRFPSHSDKKKAKSGKFRYCGDCKTICYCSEKCQKTDWKDHKPICKQIILTSK